MLRLRHNRLCCCGRRSRLLDWNCSSMSWLRGLLVCACTCGACRQRSCWSKGLLLLLLLQRRAATRGQASSCRAALPGAPHHAAAPVWAVRHTAGQGLHLSVRRQSAQVLGAAVPPAAAAAVVVAGTTLPRTAGCRRCRCRHHLVRQRWMWDDAVVVMVVVHHP